MNKTLMEYFNDIPDFRRPQGLVHNLAFCLTLIVMGLMSGYNGIRPIGDFIERNKEEIITYFKLKKRWVPNYSTIRRIIIATDFEKLNEAFFQWASQNQELNEEEVYAIDGKCIRSTVTNSNDPKQNFLSMVTAFGQNSKKVIAQTKFYNKKDSEMSKVLDIFEMIEVKGKTFTLDALHCQKKL
jgi:hypothetical protein